MDIVLLVLLNPLIIVFNLIISTQMSRADNRTDLVVISKCDGMFYNVLKVMFRMYK